MGDGSGYVGTVVCRCGLGRGRRRCASGLGLWGNSGGFGLKRGLVELGGSCWVGVDGLGLDSEHDGFCLLVGLDGWFVGFECLELGNW